MRSTTRNSSRRLASRWLPKLAGLLLLVAGSASAVDPWLGLPQPAPAVDCGSAAAFFPQAFGVGREGEPEQLLTEEQLLYRYAPQILQWVSREEGKGCHGHYFQYFLTAIDYDGDWAATNNWEHATADRRASLPAVVYGGLIAATANQLYLQYYFFHPRDYAGSDFECKFGWAGTEHENDLEGGMLVVERLSGKIIHAYSLEHNRFDERHVGRSPILENPPLNVWVEAGGHGAHLFLSTVELKPNRRFFMRYWDDPQRGVPAPASSSPDLVHSAAALRLKDRGTARALESYAEQSFHIEPLWGLFACMFQQDGKALRLARELFAERQEGRDILLTGYHYLDYTEAILSQLALYRALRGDGSNKAQNAAHFPWGQGDDPDRFFDPVDLVLKQEDKRHENGHAPVSCAYEFNPYLRSLLGGQLADRAGDRPFWEKLKLRRSESREERCKKGPKTRRALSGNP